MGLFGSRFFRWGVRCIGFVIFGYLLYRIGPGKLWQTIGSVRPVYFIAAFPIFFVMIWVKSVKMQFLMRRRLSLRQVYGLNAFAFSVGSLTPGRLGEFSKIVFLSKAGVPVAESFSVTFIDRVSDVVIMIVCAVFGLFTFFGPAAGGAGLLALIVIGIAGLVLWFSDRVLRKIVRGNWRGLVELEGAAIRAYIRGIPMRVWSLTMAFTLIYLGLYFFQMWILSKGLNLPISYFQTTMAVSAAAIPAILPISVGNIGPRDAILAEIFRRMGWGAAGGFALATLILALFLTNGIVGLFFFPRREGPSISAHQ